MGYQDIHMGCGGGKEEKTDAPQGEWVDHWAKLAFHVEKKTKPKKIIAAINEMLNTVDRGCEEKMQIEALVPLWTPDYTHSMPRRSSSSNSSTPRTARAKT